MPHTPLPDTDTQPAAIFFVEKARSGYTRLPTWNVRTQDRVLAHCSDHATAQHIAYALNQEQSS